MGMQDTLNTISGRLIGVVVLERAKGTILEIETEMGMERRIGKEKRAGK